MEEIIDNLDSNTIKKFNRFLEHKDDNDVITTIKEELKEMFCK